MVNGHRNIRLSEAAAAVDKEKTMNDPNAGSQSAAQVRMLELNKETEYRVRQHTTYSVSRHSPRAGSSPLADNMNLDQANDLARAYGRTYPGSKVTCIQEDRRKFDSKVGVSVADGKMLDIHDQLIALPAGSRITCWLEARRDDRPALVVDWAVLRPTEVYPAEGCAETVNWEIGGLMWDEVTKIKTALGDLPYPLAAAMRRNARASGDQTMLKLLDEAQVAVDA
jgi:hypothetical protein